MLARVTEIEEGNKGTVCWYVASSRTALPLVASFGSGNENTKHGQAILKKRYAFPTSHWFERLRDETEQFSHVGR